MRWKTRTVSERFWSHVDRRSDQECWVWRGATQPNGYGSFRPSAKVHVRSHRFAFEEAGGSIPCGAVVLHICDNPPCCNPAHLRVGTQKDNVRDCIKKGRFRPGKLRVKAKLNPDAVREILAAPTGYGTGEALAKKFGVTSAAISAVRSRKNWKHVE